MKKIQLKLGLMVLVGSVWACQAHADIEAIVPVIDKVRGAQEEITTQMQNITALQEATDSAVQTVQGGLNQATGLAQQVTNPAGLVNQAAGMATTTMMGTLGNVVDGSAGEDEVAEEVKNTYSPAYDDPLPEKRKHFDEVNKKAVKDVGRLFARAIILRQELMAEESPDTSDMNFETIKEAQDASNALLIQSAKRWNKILEIQSYVNEFNNSVTMQNFLRDEED